HPQDEQGERERRGEDDDEAPPAERRPQLAHRDRRRDGVEQERAEALHWTSPRVIRRNRSSRFAFSSSSPRIGTPVMASARTMSAISRSSPEWRNFTAVSDLSTTCTAVNAASASAALSGSYV